jgi:uncharacterized membrane protein YfcA
MYAINHFANACTYSRPDLVARYLVALAIALIAVAMAGKYGTRRLHVKAIRWTLNVVIVIVAFFAWHFLYLVFINGDFFGCPISPILSPV